ncbi:MAG: DUF4389 domain-containing protein [Candidatus Porifericomitaceae bacterium WSBS_2022_MAG_OTU9]
MSTVSKTDGQSIWGKCRKWLAQRRDDWIRVVFMIVYMIIFHVAFTMLLWALVLAQFACRIVMGKANDSLARAGVQLSDYSRDIIRFVSYKSETKPWPFSDSKPTRRSGRQAES